MQFNKFQFKAKVLRLLTEGDLSSKEIYERLPHDYHNKNFRSALFQLKRRGYLSKKGEKPYMYSLTKKGRIHAQDPYIYAKNRYARHGSTMLQNDTSGETDGSDNSSVSGGSSGSIGSGAYADNTHLLTELSEKDAEILRLQTMLKNMSESHHETKQQLNRITNPTPLNPMKEKMLNDRKKARYSIAQKWSRRYLTYEFFREWTSEFPYMMRGHKKLKRNCVEILGRNNPEIARGHVDHALRPQEIAAAQFRITEIKGNGLLIESEALAGGKKLLVW
jgi:hypothetical protein